MLHVVLQAVHWLSVRRGLYSLLTNHNNHRYISTTYNVCVDTVFYLHLQLIEYLATICYALTFTLIVVAWLSSNGLISINVVTLHRARLVLGWVTACKQVNHSGILVASHLHWLNRNCESGIFSSICHCMGVWLEVWPVEISTQCYLCVGANNHTILPFHIHQS